MEKENINIFIFNENQRMMIIFVEPNTDAYFCPPITGLSQRKRAQETKRKQ